MAKHKPEWYEVVWTIGMNGKEQSKLFEPSQKEESDKFYKKIITEVKKTKGSDVRMYLTHTNKLYDILQRFIHHADGTMVEGNI